MPVRWRAFRGSIQTKVLVTVVTVLVLLPVVTLWIVDRHITAHMHDEARQSLATAEAVFQKSLQIRTRNALDRFKRTVNEPRFKAVAQLEDAKTMSALLRDIANESGDETEALVYNNAEGAVVATTRRESTVPLDAFVEGARPAVQAVIKDGEPGTDRQSCGGRVLDVIAVPVWIRENGPLVGVLVAGIRVGTTALQDLRSLTGAEIVLIADGAVADSTLPAAEVKEIPRLKAAPDNAGLLHSEPSLLLIDGEHYLGVSAWAHRANGQPGFQYELLSSYERRWQALNETRRTLIWWSAGIIGFSTLCVWLFIRRITRPLRELRDSAEAVGRGDFSRRIERFSNDECGDLAVAFNQMTENLQSSRAELERSVLTLKTMQAQLIQSEKLSAVGEFVAGVAHELNNPLTAVVGYSDLLGMDTKELKVREYTDRILRSAQRCQKIVQSLLSFARQHAPERKLIQLNEVLAAVLEIMAYDLRTSNVTVVSDFAPNLPSILGDSHQLQQVFVNVLNNARQAVQAFRRDGRITLRTLVVENKIHVQFEDNGPGIKPEHLQRIFDPFFTTKPVGKGTGLGLSLSYGIIQEHGGVIRVASEAGKGATFTIELPISANQNAPASSRAATQDPWGRGKGKAVLVIDDEPLILDLTRELLIRDGCDVEICASGANAAEVMLKRPFDVILCDWKMPGLSGGEFYEQLLLINADAARRVLFMTGDVMNESFQDFLRRHQKACLPKPFSIDDFRDAVEKVTPAK